MFKGEHGLNLVGASPNGITNGSVLDIRLHLIRRVHPEVSAVEKLHVVIVEAGNLVGLARRAVAGARDLDLSAAVGVA